MASGGSSVGASSPGGAGKGQQLSISLSSPKGTGGQCLCSPTTHKGSFRCRFHRSLASTWMRRSKSMPSSSEPTTPTATKPLENV